MPKRYRNETERGLRRVAFRLPMEMFRQFHAQLALDGLRFDTFGKAVASKYLDMAKKGEKLIELPE
jgi:hypothetical protein